MRNRDADKTKLKISFTAQHENVLTAAEAASIKESTNTLNIFVNCFIVCINPSCSQSHSS